MSMDFYRRPQLAGTALRFPDYPVLRGSVHRHDPDGVSSAPYFPLAAGGDFNLLVDDTPFTVTLTANPSVQTVITSVNTVISSKGYAYDEGGVLHIRTLSKTGSVEVTGTASVALALGFDLRLGMLRTYAGDVASSGEGRINNPFGATMPVPGEGLNSESFVRALARLSANLDVLLSDGNRTTPQFVEWGTVTAIDDTSGNYSLVTITPSAPYVGLGVSNGLGSLHSGVTLAKAAITPFFYLTAALGYYPSPHQAVGVVKATVLADLTGAAPYANAATAAGPGNVFGINLVKAGPYTVEEVLGGRVVYRAGGFGAARVGDYVEIRPDANTTKIPWANDGIRWKVEDIIGDGLSLAPLSRAELTDAGLSGAGERQPVVSLNDKRGNTENFGYLYLWTGPVIDSPKLVVSPPMPASGVGTVVWAAIPSSPRTRGHGEGMSNPALNILTQGFPHNDVIISKGSMDLTVGTLTVSGMVIRKNGLHTDVSSTLTGLGSYTGYIVLTTSGTPTLSQCSPPLLPGGGIPLARVVSGAITHDLRIVGEVGSYVSSGMTYGQLPNLDTAIQYCYLCQVSVKEIVSLYGETSPAGGWFVENSSLTIRGASPSIVLTRNATDPLFTTTTSAKVILKNLTLPTSGEPALTALFTANADTIWAVDCFDASGRFISLANFSTTNTSYRVGIYGGSGDFNIRATNNVRIGEGASSLLLGSTAASVWLGANATTLAIGGASSLLTSYCITRLQKDTSIGLLTDGVTYSLTAAAVTHTTKQGSIVFRKDGGFSVELYYDRVATLVGGGLDASALHYHTAANIVPTTGAFNKILTATENTVQKALDKLDDHTHTTSDITNWVAPMLLTTDQTAAGIKTFSSTPRSSAGAPTLDSELTRKSYVDDAAFIVQKIAPNTFVTPYSIGGDGYTMSAVHDSGTITIPVLSLPHDVYGNRATLRLKFQDSGDDNDYVLRFTLNGVIHAASSLNGVVMAYGGETNYAGGPINVGTYNAYKPLLGYSGANPELQFLAVDSYGGGGGWRKWYIDLDATVVNTFRLELHPFHSGYGPSSWHNSLVCELQVLLGSTTFPWPCDVWSADMSTSQLP
jgi:hypothetical protein